MGSPIQTDLNLLCSYAQQCTHILEVGGGISTNTLATAIRNLPIKMTSIELFEDINSVKSSWVEYLYGWSIRQDDFLPHTDPRFRNSRYKGVPDEEYAWHQKRLQAPYDLLRKVFADNVIDFYFGDSGEYCGIPEWEIVKHAIPINGIVALHDIHFPKSIKNFEVYDEIRKSDCWEIIVKTDSIAGLVIARKVNM